VSFMRLRSERWRWARKNVESGGPPRPNLITVPEIQPASRVSVESESQSA
jgi:hypothetical protein